MPEQDKADPDRLSATTLIYLCALCSSLTSVLLGYGEGFLMVFVSNKKLSSKNAGEGL